MSKSSHCENHRFADCGRQNTRGTDKTHVGPVNLLHIIMFKIRKIKPNSSSVRLKLKSFQWLWINEYMYNLFWVCSNEIWIIIVIFKKFLLDRFFKEYLLFLNHIIQCSTISCRQGQKFQTRGGIYHGLNRYKPSCYKQVSDTQNVQNCHKQVLNNKTVWNRVSKIIKIPYICQYKC